eukprot:TRINITY_DN7597_c0_g1_i2.p1 TRINITY_DN7597_c0_g1~~TRINITY_DN7597_c0_g1_i2.p1  ORF type:complete len:203 (+),score=27.93 TRINITY_DN7597_c0_g1_i2:226-834(+)
MDKARERNTQLRQKLIQEPPHRYQGWTPPPLPPPSFREFAADVCLPAESMQARTATQQGASLYQISGRMRMCFNSNRFELALAERARSTGSNFPPTRSCSLTDHGRADFRQSNLVSGSFEHVMNDRYTFWCDRAVSENGVPRMSFAQFEGVIGDREIQIGFPYRGKSLHTGVKGPCALRGSRLLRTLEDVGPPAMPPRLCPR